MVQHTHDRIRNLLTHVAESHSSIMSSVQQLAQTPVLDISNQVDCIDAFYASTQRLSEVLVTFNLVPPSTSANEMLEDSETSNPKDHKGEMGQNYEEILHDIQHRLKLQEDAVMKVYELAQTVGSVSLLQKMEDLSQIWGSMRRNLESSIIEQ